MAIAALILGILGIIGSFCIGIGIVPAIAGVVLGILGMKAAQKLPGEPQKGLAIAGIITGAIGIVISLLWIVLVVVADDSDFEGINVDRPDGECNFERFMQDPDC